MMRNNGRRACHPGARRTASYCLNSPSRYLWGGAEAYVGNRYWQV